MWDRRVILTVMIFACMISPSGSEGCNFPNDITTQRWLLENRFLGDNLKYLEYKDGLQYSTETEYTGQKQTDIHYCTELTTGTNYTYFVRESHQDATNDYGHECVKLYHNPAAPSLLLMGVLQSVLQNCSFAKNEMCGFRVVETSNKKIVWQLKAGVAAGSDKTLRPPDVEKAGNGWYMFLNGSDPSKCTDSVARLQSAEIGHRGFVCVTFAYQMTGTDVRNLSLHVVDYGHWLDPAWKKLGQQIPEWQTASVNVSLTDRHQTV